MIKFKNKQLTEFDLISVFFDLIIANRFNLRLIIELMSQKIIGSAGFIGISD